MTFDKIEEDIRMFDANSDVDKEMKERASELEKPKDSCGKTNKKTEQQQKAAELQKFKLGCDESKKLDQC